MLQRLLDSHPQVVCRSELLGDPMLRDSYHFDFEALNNQTLTQYLDKEIWSVKDGKSNVLAKGFKLMYSQWKGLFGEYLLGEGVTTIHLIRRNVLNTVLSLKLNQANDGIMSKPEHPPDLKVKILPQELEQAVRRNERFKEMFERLFPGMVTIYYEDLCHCQEACLGKIQDILGVPHASLSCNLRKQRVNTQSTHIVNYEALKEHFRNTIYHSMFED